MPAVGEDADDIDWRAVSVPRFEGTKLQMWFSPTLRYDLSDAGLIAFRSAKDVTARYKRSPTSGAWEIIEGPARARVRYHAYSNTILHALDGGSDDCGICEDSCGRMDSRRGFLDTCEKHVFHFSCLATWFDVNNTCPLCGNGKKISHLARLRFQLVRGASAAAESIGALPSVALAAPERETSESKVACALPATTAAHRTPVASAVAVVCSPAGAPTVAAVCTSAPSNPAECEVSTDIAADGLTGGSQPSAKPWPLAACFKPTRAVRCDGGPTDGHVCRDAGVGDHGARSDARDATAAPPARGGASGGGSGGGSRL